MKTSLRLQGDIVGGITSAVITLPIAIASGLLAFSPLGPGYAALGATAGLYGAVLASIAAVFFGSTPTQITGPKLSIAIILTALISDLMQNPTLAGEAGPGIPIILSLTFGAIFLAGLFQLLFGLLRGGHLIKYIPYPVIAGYLGGVAILILTSQIDNFIGTDTTQLLNSFPHALFTIQPATLLISVLTVLIMVFSPRLFPGLSSSLPALLVGTIIHIILGRYLSPASLGPTIGHIPLGLPKAAEFMDLRDLADPTVLREQLPLIIGPALSMALLGAMASLMGVLVVESVTNARYNGNRELVGLGVGNLLSAFFGGLISAGSTSRTMINIEAGGSTKLSGIVHCLCLLLVVALLGPVVSMIPLSVIAGILMVAAVRMIRNASNELGWHKSNQRQYRKEMSFNLPVMVLVMATVVLYDLVLALALGLILSLILFMVSESRKIVKGVYYGDMMHSKMIRNAYLTDKLREHGKEIVVFEIEGSIFFGSIESLFKNIDTHAHDSSYVILDLKHVRQIDSNGTRFFQQLNSALAQSNKFLLVSHLSRKNTWYYFNEMGIIEKIGRERFFSDTEAALAWAEDHLLFSKVGAANIHAEVPLGKMDALQGLNEKQLNILRDKLTRLSFNKGDLIFREGESERSVFFLAAGTVSVQIQIPGESRKKRISSFGPGVVFGELALLEGNPRSADIVADEEAICYKFDAEGFQQLTDEHHDIAVRLMINIGRILSRRLLLLTDELRVLEQ